MTPAPFPAPVRTCATTLLEAVMPIGLGSAFEAEVATLAGITGFDPGSLDIALLNLTGPSTVRLTVAVNVDTTKLKALIQKYAK
jgi:hypothetical protein